MTRAVLAQASLNGMDYFRCPGEQLRRASPADTALAMRPHSLIVP